VVLSETAGSDVVGYSGLKAKINPYAVFRSVCACMIGSDCGCGLEKGPKFQICRRPQNWVSGHSQAWEALVMQSFVETCVYCLFICQLGSGIAIQECPTLKGQSDHILSCLRTHTT